jgi:hypothetical protein
MESVDQHTKIVILRHVPMEYGMGMSKVLIAEERSVPPVLVWELAAYTYL